MRLLEIVCESWKFPASFSNLASATPTLRWSQISRCYDEPDKIRYLCMLSRSPSTRDVRRVPGRKEQAQERPSLGLLMAKKKGKKKKVKVTKTLTLGCFSCDFIDRYDNRRGVAEIVDSTNTCYCEDLKAPLGSRLLQSISLT